ncbi:MAG: CTQ-dependent glycine oxidase GoxA [Edaphobacter sp.]
MTDSASNASRITRRDFLATVSLLPFATPWIPRAAFAQNARNSRPADTAVARLAIYPPLGISRIGNSKEWFLAPEVPGLPPLPDGKYKDGPQQVKKQVQRFRIYAFNKAGEVIREITTKEARIEWTVHVANTKAAWYGFNNPLDNGPIAPGLPSQRRNASVTGKKNRAEMLVIDPGAKTITGANTNVEGSDPSFDMVGRFWRTLDVKLGHLQTDPAGRLLIFPGDGVSRSAYPDNPIRNFSDNDGWHDDWCDGVVQAKLTFTDGSPMIAEDAWVVCCGPDFAPDIQPFISLYDVMADVAIDAGWAEAPKPPLSFQKYIYPLFRKLAFLSWVSAAHHLKAGWLGVGDFSDPAMISRLSDPSPANADFRKRILSLFRDPNSDAIQQYKLPYMLGDGINYAESPVRWFRIPNHQYAILQLWAEGAFISDLDSHSGHEIATFEQIPLSEQPDALTRAALEPCSGGAFHPGVELTWPVRHKELYRSLCRIALATDRTPDLIQDLGRLLTPDEAFHGYNGTPPAIGPQMPGDLTRWMGLPWQCDAFSCQYVAFANDFPNAAWWPALLPIDVLPEAFYRIVMDPKEPAEERMRFFESRVSWSRGAAGIGYHVEASYSDGLERMIYVWDRMGFVVRRPGPTDANRPTEIPPVLYVEVDRGSLELSGDPAVPRPPHATVISPE